MGDTSSWSIVRQRTSGKWQIPLLGISLLCLAASFWQFRARTILHGPFPPSLLTAMEIGEFTTRGEWDHAIREGEKVLASADRNPDEDGTIHRQLARAYFALAERSTVPAAKSDGVIQHFEQAARFGDAPTAEDFLQAGQAFEWRRQFSSAVEHYEKAIYAGLSDPSVLQARVLSLRLSALGEPPESLVEPFDDFAATLDADERELRLWAIEQSVNLRRKQGRLQEAADLMASYAAAFCDTPAIRRFESARADLLREIGAFEEAERALRAVRSGMEASEETFARSGWLLGRTILEGGREDRAPEALSFFDEVLRTETGGEYDAACRVGAAEAMSLMGRHEDALDAYERAIDELSWSPGARGVDPDVLRTSLSVSADWRRMRGDVAGAVEYARLAARLVDPESDDHKRIFHRKLAELLAVRAAEYESRSAEEAIGSADITARSPEARELFAEAAELYSQLSAITVHDEHQSSESAWKAAELTERSGRGQRAAELYRAFVERHASDAHVSRALLRIGRLRQAEGEFAAAIEAFRECHDRFPRSLDGGRSLVPLAECCLSLGPEHRKLAERTLLKVVDDPEVFTPEAPEFQDALLLLGETYYRDGSMERAASIFEEALSRNPGDPRSRRTRFLMADAYRRSALRWKEDVAAGAVNLDAAEAGARLLRAANLYREVIADYESSDPTVLRPVDHQRYRHALLYEADCYFESQDYRHAIRLYEQVIGIHPDRSAALQAHVQIINCQVFLGQLEEARAALARAVVVADGMPDAILEESPVQFTRSDWKEYFRWLESAGLF